MTQHPEFPQSSGGRRLGGAWCPRLFEGTILEGILAGLLKGLRVGDVDVFESSRIQGQVGCSFQTKNQIVNKIMTSQPSGASDGPAKNIRG